MDTEWPATAPNVLVPDAVTNFFEPVSDDHHLGVTAVCVPVAGAELDPADPPWRHQAAGHA